MTQNTFWNFIRSQLPGSSDTQDRIIYLGNQQDAYPRLLVLDQDVSAIELRIWMFLRLHVEPSHRSNPFPAYEDIMRQLNIGSKETVAIALLALRATRWLAVIGPKVDHRNRQLRNLYALNSEPFSPKDILELDQDYMSILDKLCQHRSVRLKELGQRLNEGMNQAVIDDIEPYSVLDEITTRLEAQHIVQQPVSAKCNGTFFGRIKAEYKENNLLVDGNIDNTEPSTKIVPGPLSQVQKSYLDLENPFSEPKTTQDPVSKYENRTAISSSSSFYKPSTTTKEYRKQTSGGTSPSKSDHGRSGGTSPSKSDHGRSGGTSPSKLDLDRSGGTSPSNAGHCKSGAGSGINTDHTPSGGSSAINNEPRLLLDYHDDILRLTPNEKTMLQRVLMRLKPPDRQHMLDEVAGQLQEKQGTNSAIRNVVHFTAYLAKQFDSEYPPWSSSCERMRRRREARAQQTQHSNKAVARQRAHEAIDKKTRQRNCQTLKALSKSLKAATQSNSAKNTKR